MIQAGDKLVWRQWEASGTTAGIVMGFTDGTQNWSAGVNLVDQHGEGLHTSVILGWNYRIGNLSPAAGKTISYFAVSAGGSGAGQWDWYYQDLVFVGADGTVIPLYNHNQTISLYGFGSSGMTQGGYEINHDTNATSYSWWASTMYYHGDQIGSSRLMTSDGGWPVWQGTFLPYGEEYNPQITTNHYKFTGKERDAESGLDYFGARYYGSGLGRFITPDWAAKPAAVPYAVLGDPQSLNLYTYVRNIPTTNVDTDGHETLNANTNDRGNTKWVPCDTQACSNFDHQMSGLILGGVSIVCPVCGRAIAAVGAIHAIRSGDKKSAALNAAVAVIPGGKPLSVLSKAARAERLAANIAQGKAAEQAVTETLKAEGRQILGQQVGVQTSEGLRKVDILTQDAAGQLANVEVKSGNAVRGADQVAKDTEIAAEGGTYVGKNAPEAMRGQKIQVPTEVKKPQ